MGIKEDIRDTADIRLLIDRFYDKVRRDETIGYIFNDIARVDWPAHLPRMYSFWEMVVFQTGAFKGNPMDAHMRLHQKHELTPAHFEKWLQLFTDTVNELFQGEKAELAKKQAGSVAGVMLARLSEFTRAGH